MHEGVLYEERKQKRIRTSVHTRNGEFAMRKFLTTHLIALVLFASHSALAQEACVSSPESFAAAKRAIAAITGATRVNTIEIPPSFSIIEQEHKSPHSPFPPREFNLPWGTPAPYMYGQLGQSQTPAIPAAELEEKRFSWWGYRHAELHDGGVIAELVEKSRPVNCCNGVWQGECRVTSYVTDGVGPRMVLIDGLVCPISPKTKIVQLNRFAEADKVVVCANRTAVNNKDLGVERKCPETFCLGGGKLHM